jgi:hypothetical protein
MLAKPSKQAGRDIGVATCGLRRTSQRLLGKVRRRFFKMSRSIRSRAFSFFN